jgi:hypothetical protein
MTIGYYIIKSCATAGHRLLVKTHRGCRKINKHDSDLYTSYKLDSLTGEQDLITSTALCQQDGALQELHPGLCHRQGLLHQQAVSQMPHPPRHYTLHLCYSVVTVVS